MKRWLKQNRGFLIFLLCLGFFRTAIADWNPIPSGSMRPTLLEGDVVLVNRLAYDFKLPLSDIALIAIDNPKRGDIVTFSSPKDGVRLIKRLVGVPSDVVEMRDEMLFINGAPASYSEERNVEEVMDDGGAIPAIRAIERIAGSEHAVQFLPAVAGPRSFGPVVVPQDCYLVLGDNRDNSADSRFIGFVPRKLLIGRAHHIIVSANILGDWMPRIERLGARVQ